MSFEYRVVWEEKDPGRVERWDQHATEVLETEEAAAKRYSTLVDAAKEGVRIREVRLQRRASADWGTVKRTVNP